LNVKVVREVFGDVAHKLNFHRVSRFQPTFVCENGIDGFVCWLLDNHDLFDCFLNLVEGEKCVIKTKLQSCCLVLGVYLLGKGKLPQSCVFSWTLGHILRYELLLEIWRFKLCL
jgi:hypothetical protein